MKTLNRSEIFKNAWSLVKSQGLTISAALKSAWAIAKGVVASVAKVYEGATGNLERKMDEFKLFCDTRKADYKAVLEFEYSEGDAAGEFFMTESREWSKAAVNAESLNDFRNNNPSPTQIIGDALKAFINYGTLTGKHYQF